MEHTTLDPQPKLAASTDSQRAAQVARGAVKEQAETLGSDVRELGTLVQDAVRAEIARLRDQGDRLVSKAHERYDDAESSLAESVRSRPLRSLALAAGAGLVLGLIARR